MSLRQLVEQRRADESTPRAHACYALKAGATTLDVSASDGVHWQFPWQQFTSARHSTTGEADTSVLTFTTHAVTLRGHGLATLREAIRDGRLAALRVAPGKYAKSAGDDLFIVALHVQPTDAAPSSEG